MTDIKPMRVVCRDCGNAPCTCPSRARSGLDAGLLARAIARVNYRTHDYSQTGEPRLDDGFEWYASPREMADDIIAALASSGEAAPVDGLRAAQLESYGDWLVENGLPEDRRAAAVQRACLFVVTLGEEAEG